MLFFDPLFLFTFLPLVLVLYRIFPERLRNAWLFIASCVFYASSSLFFLPLLLFSTALDYWIGRRISRSDAPRARRAWLTLSIVVNLSLLALFKYAGWLTLLLRDDLGWTAVPHVVTPLPIGISFYTFQSMSYAIDLYRRHTEPARRFVDFGAYVTLFPQLIAGPIVRFSELRKQLDSPARATVDRYADGIAFLVTGLGKKLLVADTLARFADPLFEAGAPGFAAAWVGITLYSLQIYYDFSGYSDMAIGLGRMIGFDLPQNFDSPYRATSFSDFWRRWHMTLSRWLRDNLYIPLGGNRRGTLRTRFNLMATMVLGGLWHGASATFLAWGAWHGALLGLERWLARLRFDCPVRVRQGLVFLAVTVGWVFFRIDTWPEVMAWLRGLAGLSGMGAVSPVATVAMAGVLVATWTLPNSWESVGRRWSYVRVAGLSVCLVASLIVGAGQATSPFLYYRF